MKDELLKTIVLNTQNRYESALRWCGILLLLVFFFHLTIVGPYLKAAGRFDDAVKERKRLSQLKNAVGDLQNEIRALVGSAKLSKTQVVKMVEDLRADFRAMDMTIKEIKNPIAAASTRSQADELLQRPSFNTSMQIQTPLQAQTKVEQRTFNLDEATRERIRSARSKLELKSAILPVIESEIIIPRFSKLNDYWQKMVIPKLEKTEKSVIKDLNKLSADYPENKKVWDDVTESVRKIRSTAEATVFEAELGSDWWSTVAGKLATIEDMKRAASEQIMRIAEHNESLNELNRMINSAVKNQETFQEAIRVELENIVARFKELRGELKEMNRGLGIVALDLQALVRNFPLILGILFAFLITWTTHRSRELRWVVERLDPEGKESTLREFLLPSGFLQMRANQTTWWNRFSSATGTAVLCLLSWFWIGTSVLQLRAWSEISGFRLATITLISFILVLLACVYRWKLEKGDFLQV